MAGDDFAAANTIEQAILGTYDAITVIGPLNNGDTQLIFTQSTSPPNGEVDYALHEIDTNDLNNYTGANVVPLSKLSPNGLIEFQQNTVSEALQDLPVEYLDQFLPEGMDIIDVERISRGAIDADQAQQFLQDGLVEAFDSYRMDANNTPDGGSIDMNDPEHSAVFDRLDATVTRLNVVRDIGSYQNQLNTALEGPLEGIGMNARDAQNARNMVAGEPPIPAPEIAPQGQKL